MENFLKKMEEQIEIKIISCLKGESILKPFSKVYQKVREEEKVKVKKPKVTKASQIQSFIYAKGERSIYEKAIINFLLENPDFVASLEVEDPEFD